MHEQMLKAIANIMNVYGHDTIKSERFADGLIATMFFNPFSQKPMQVIISDDYGLALVTITRHDIEYDREKTNYTIAFKKDLLYTYNLITNLERIFETYIPTEFDSCFRKYKTQYGKVFENITTLLLYFSDDIVTQFESYLEEIQIMNALDDNDSITIEIQIVDNII